MKTRLTTRGKLVLGIAATGFAMGWLFGGRNLNLVVVPAVVLVAVTGLYVSRFEEPRVVRNAPTHGEQGETRRLDLYVESKIGYPATVLERTGPGIANGQTHRLVTDGRWIREDLVLERRGRHTIGPTRVTARDPLGLWERDFTTPSTASVIVYPKIRRLEAGGHLLRDFVGVTDDRDRFDSVREYQEGDPLRDINWKASAKRPGDLIVTKYAGEGVVSRVTIAAEAQGPGTDTVAEAAASIAAFLLDAGLAVGLHTAEDHLEPGYGEAHRAELLESLAVLEQGPLDPEFRGDADISVHAPRDARHVQIRVGGDSMSYVQLRAPPAEEVSA